MDPQALEHQSSPLAQLERQLRSSTASIHVVLGASSIGKSWIARRAARRRVSSDAHVFLARGQESWQKSALAPFRYGIATTGRRLSTKSATTSASDALTAAGKATLGITELIRILASVPARGDATRRVLTDSQRRMLVDLKDVVPRGRWVLIADDLHLWDTESIELLRLCVLPSLRQAMPFLAQCDIIATMRDNVGDSNPSVDRLFADVDPSYIFVPPMDPRNVASALEHFGFDTNAIPSDTLVRLSGGHLQLLKDLATYFVRAGRNVSFAADGGEVDIYNIVKTRIKATVPDADSITEALGVISAIGLQFSKHQAICLLDAIQSFEARDTLDKLIELSLLERVGSSLAFEHADIRDAFYDRVGPAKAKYHQRFAQCMRELHPSDYATRAYHHRLSLDEYSAGIMAIHAELQQVRSHRYDADHAWPDRVSVPEALVIAWGEPLRIATRRWLSGDYPGAVCLLQSMPIDGPPTLLAERAYLLADCWLKTLSVPERRQAVDLLVEHTALSRQEFELWFRLASLLLVAYIQTRLEDAASRLELDIASALGERISIDVGYASYKFSLFRRSDALHDPDVAMRRLREAVTYFEPREGLSPSPTEYLRCSTNLTGCHILVGEYEEAIARSRTTAEHLEVMPSASARSLNLANNTLLAGYLAAQEDPQTVIEQYRLLIDYAFRFEDLLLLRVNLSTVLIRSGNHTEATELLALCLDEVERSLDADGYYSYYVKNNYVLLRYCTDLMYAPIDDWTSMERYLQDMPRGTRSFMAERHGVIRSLLAAHAPRDTEDLESAIRAHRPLPKRGPWTFFARAFLLSETQYWSDG